MLKSTCIRKKDSTLNNSLILKKGLGSLNRQFLRKGVGLYNQETSWIVKNGEKIRLWKDNWLGINPFRSLIHGPLNKGEDDWKISKIFGPRGEWNLSSLSFSLPHHIESLIHQTPRQLMGAEVDSTRWRTNVDGKFSSREGHKAILSNTSNLQTTGNQADWMWHCHTNSRVKHFLWLAHQDRLSTRNNLFHRKIIQAKTVLSVDT